MNAKETKIQPLIEGTKQYVVPLFQRHYSWTSVQWYVLWRDLLDLYEEEDPRSHFIGAIVTMQAISVPEGVNKFILIDGQQRLTTILLLLALIRDEAKGLTGTLAGRIDDLLLKNRYQEGNDLYKLLPTQLDRSAFIAIMNGDNFEEDSPITRAYLYFQGRLHDTVELNLERLHHVVTRSLLVVSIVLDSEDNPHVIFESLNAKGRSLTQADLIRNYFFMRIHPDRQEFHYRKYWMPIQESLGDELTECIRHFLMRDGRIVKQDEVFYTLKGLADRRPGEGIVEYLAELSTFAGYYVRLVHPESELNPTIRSRAERLKRLGVTTAYPFLLNLYSDLDRGDLDDSDVVEVMDVLENFIIRRFVCGVPTNTLNKLFPPLYGQASERGHIVEAVKTILAAKGYPRDAEFAESLAGTRFYGGDRSTKGRIILERLESAHSNREPVATDQLTLEHVMPQALTEAWKASLGSDWLDVHERWLHTLGNLTLTGYNQQLSNADFDSKKRLLSESRLVLNRYFAEVDVWDEAALRTRAERLARKALEIWSDFSPPDGFPPTASDLNPAESYWDFERVLNSLEAASTKPHDRRLAIYKRQDGRLFSIKYSKSYDSGTSKHYWFGIKPSVLEKLCLKGVSEIVFILGSTRVAMAPIGDVQAYCATTKASLNPDGSIRHFHILISDDDVPHLYWSQQTPRFPLMVIPMPVSIDHPST